MRRDLLPNRLWLCIAIIFLIAPHVAVAQDPAAKIRKDTGEKVTIHHLLTHTSGIQVYMTLNERELAIKNYKKSVELNPNNTNAVEVLKRLEKTP